MGQFLDAAGYPKTSQLPRATAPPAWATGGGAAPAVPHRPGGGTSRSATAGRAGPAAGPDAQQPGRHPLLTPARPWVSKGLRTSASLRPVAVPSRHTAAFWWANTPTVTTPGHWFTSDSNASGS
jgi:hypothetical protein